MYLCALNLILLIFLVQYWWSERLVSTTPDRETLSVEFVRMWSSKDDEFSVTHVGEVISCLRPCIEQNSRYRLIPFGICDFWLLIKFIFKSPRMYTSLLLKQLVLEMALESLSKNPD